MTRASDDQITDEKPNQETRDERADELVNRLSELGAIAFCVERMLHVEEAEGWDVARYALIGLGRLVDVAREEAMALADSLTVTP